MAIIAITLALMLMDCSGDMARMKGKSDLAPSTPMGRDQENFCARYPDDVACKGPKQ
jgi:hypothetical protein